MFAPVSAGPAGRGVPPLHCYTQATVFYICASGSGLIQALRPRRRAGRGPAAAGPKAGAPQSVHRMHGHKFELRVVVFREGDELRAFPSIAKVARDSFDASTAGAETCDLKAALINNITTSAKATQQVVGWAGHALERLGPQVCTCCNAATMDGCTGRSRPAD